MDYKLLLYVAVPYAINFAVSWYNGRGKKAARKNNRTNWGTLAFGVLALQSLATTMFVIAAFALASQPAQDAMTQCGFGTDTHAGLVTQRVASCVYEDSALLQSLKNKHARFTYKRVGHAAYTQCSWCSHQDFSDYVIFLFPSIAAEYILAAVVLAISHANKSRLLSLAALVAVASVEAFLLAIHDGYFNDINQNDRPVFNPFTPESTGVYRRLIFAILIVGFGIWDNPTNREITDHERLENIVNQQKMVFRRLQSSRLAHAAVLDDTRLRNKYVDFHRASQTANEQFTSDPEFQRIRNEILQTTEIDAMFRTAQSISNSVMGAAVSDGMLPGGIEELPPLSASNFADDE
ncbi:hypothetical protein BJ741DRAFT_611836 [Chytriomyces cf. hyalinus JEL632]|nr:hypothetical protein BJ741DRAFT_611836 [Chytriomyces cf. hyalinus JEL632]